jgi:hypothetical protein
MILFLNNFKVFGHFPTAQFQLHNSEFEAGCHQAWLLHILPGNAQWDETEANGRRDL